MNESAALDRLLLVTYFITPMKTTRQAVVLVDLLRNPARSIHMKAFAPRGRTPYIKWIAPPHLVDSVKFDLTHVSELTR